ncbi:GT2 family glycosyltransferase [Aquimarina brevivitae]|uniref:GT2 family glycosyltransferase n=1 Tax=Aquimarina brevivitae TaxID=323412 RepID=A0A4Q7PJP4_9FLAO|nr:GT2 family glycosyltransferase [Aquimarina brevivitae]
MSTIQALQDIDAEIIVVDNFSEDESCAMVKAHFPEVILIENIENVGFARAVNQGVAVAKGTYVCILNPDIVVPKTIFNSLISKLKERTASGIIGPRLIDGAGRFLPESKRNVPSPYTSFKRLFGIKIGKTKNYYATHVNPKEVGKVDVLVGAFMILERALFMEVKGFDEAYFMYGEDIDLSFTIQKEGKENWYSGEDVAIHFKGESTVKNAVYIQRFYGAMRIFYRKHFKYNLLVDTIVSSGIRIVSLLKTAKITKRTKRAIDFYLLISDDLDLMQQVKKTRHKNVILERSKSLEKYLTKDIEILLDADYISYSEIIYLMDMYQRNNFTFKIKPTGCNYFVGSDFSDGKGEVIVLNKL